MSQHRSRNAQGKPWGLVLALVCSLLLASSAIGYAAPETPDAAGFAVVALPPEALAVPADFVPAAAASVNPKMDSDLAALAAAASGNAAALAESSGLNLSGERVQVKITTHPEGVQAVTDAVAAAGGEVTGSANGDTWLQAWVPVSALAAIAGENDVYYISRPAEPVLLATTEGLAVINGPAWHAAGHRGAGVKVAIIDGGFQGYPGLRGTELPASVTVKNFVDGETDAQVNGTTVHGTACAEIVHDIAPNASLYLVKVGTDVDLQEAVTWVKTQGVNIISTSLGWYNLTPGDGTGFFADLVQSARTAGIFWTTAASNDRQAHWGGAFSDPNGNNVHNFNGTQEINYFGPGDGTAYNVPAGYGIRVFLRWDDWSAKNQNYSLSIVRWNGSSWDIVKTSDNPQNGGAGQTPTEFASYTTSGGATPYGFIIRRVSSSRNVNFEVFAPKVARLDEIVTARSLANLADAPAAMTVAALDVNAPYPQESYSSEGPTNGPGGTASGGAIKPDIAGFANVSTASYGTTDKFNGTSSATPHVAGAAALVKGAYPAYTPAQIRSFLEGRAIDMGTAGKDTIYGYGRLNLGSPPGSVTTRKAFLPLVMKSPPAPSAPVLNPIDNADGDGNFTVIWNAVADATSYTLEEDDNAGFTSPVTRYTGLNTSWNATGKAVGTYYYRARASNAYGNSGWSNVQSATRPAAQLPTRLDPVADADVLQGAPSSNTGGDEEMWVGYEHCSSGPIGIARSLIRFDTSAIPPSATIASARLYVYQNSYCDIGRRTHTVTSHRITGAWTEMGVNWNNKPGYTGQYGSVAVTSGIWDWSALDVTDLVRGWVNGSISNQGVMLRANESSGDDSAQLGFLTRDISDPNYRPYLALTYAGTAATVSDATTQTDARSALCKGASFPQRSAPAGWQPAAGFRAASLCDQ